MKFNYGDEVKVKEDAPKKYRPSEVGAICGMWKIDKEEDLINEFEVLMNTQMYTVEYIDGTDAEIPEEFLILVESYSSILKRYDES